MQRITSMYGTLISEPEFWTNVGGARYVSGIWRDAPFEVYANVLLSNTVVKERYDAHLRGRSRLAGYLDESEQVVDVFGSVDDGPVHAAIAQVRGQVHGVEWNDYGQVAFHEFDSGSEAAAWLDAVTS